MTFLKDIYTEEYLRTLGINDRQVKAILYIKGLRELTNSNYQALNGISKPMATRDLMDLVNRGLISKVGSTGKGTKYILKGSKTTQTAPHPEPDHDSKNVSMKLAKKLYKTLNIDPM